MNTVEFAALPPERKATKLRDTLVGAGLAVFGIGLAVGGVLILKHHIVVYVGVGLALLGATVADREAVTAALSALAEAAKGILSSVLGRK